MINRDFRSDTVQPCHPNILQYFQEYCAKPHTSYGNGELSGLLNEKMRQLWGRECKSFAVISGTAANATLISAMVPFYGAVLCPEFSHINEDENTAIELFSGGARVMPLHTPSGKLTPDILHDKLRPYNFGFVHHAQPKALTISNLNEQGLAYNNSELRALCQTAKHYGLAFHIDGARLANALCANHETPAQMIDGVDIDGLSFGFAKNGAFLAEILVVFNPKYYETIPYILKRTGHLPAKGEYISAQALALLQNDLWLQNAQNANQLCQKLAQKLQNHPKITILSGGLGNELFLHIPPPLAKKLEMAGFLFYPWANLFDKNNLENCYRIVVSWNHQAGDIDAFLGECQ